MLLKVVVVAAAAAQGNKGQRCWISHYIICIYNNVYMTSLDMQQQIKNEQKVENESEEKILTRKCAPEQVCMYILHFEEPRCSDLFIFFIFYFHRYYYCSCRCILNTEYGVHTYVLMTVQQ
jgi:hypothetical protein